MFSKNDNKEDNLLSPENINKKYDALFVDIDRGDIKLPMFQREFVWSKEQTAQLIDSIIKGYPIGTFIFWKTKEKLASHKNIGNHKIPNSSSGDYVDYILDGQQRITSLYAIKKGIRITKDGKEINYQDIFIDLDFDTEIDEQICVVEKMDTRRYISVYDLLNSPNYELRRKYNCETIEYKLEKYQKKLTGYDFSTITIKDYPIHIACDIFSRINTGGKSLTIFEIMVAKTYDENSDFDLMNKYSILRNNSIKQEKSLKNAKFETISETIIMQCVAGIVLNSVKSRDILTIPRKDFIDTWEKMKASLFSAIDFIRTQLYIPTSQILPYSSILVVYTYFFNKIKNKPINNKQKKLLEQFFYWVALNERYSSGTESKLAEDFQKMDLIAYNDMPYYNELELNINPKAIEIKKFNAGNSYCKAIICLLASQEPQSFDTNGRVILDNTNLKTVSNKNYHHFFPKEYIKQKDKSLESNLIANITLIDASSNIRIGKKQPSLYLEDFKKKNPNIEDTLKKHFIMDIKEYGLNEDNYEVFIQKRSQKIADKLNMKLNPSWS
jgi:hypothetical protein